MIERWPRAFSLKRRRPLKVGILADIIDDTAGAIIDRDLQAALRYYTGNIGYQRRCREGADRIGLDGKPCGRLSACGFAPRARRRALSR